MTRPDPAVEIQREYYTETASRYDTMHKHEGVDDPATRSLILSVLRSLEIRRFAGCGIRDRTRVEGLCLGAAWSFGVRSRASGSVGAGGRGGRQWRIGFAAAGFGRSAAICRRQLRRGERIQHSAPCSAAFESGARNASSGAASRGDRGFQSFRARGSWPARLFKLFLYKMGLWGAFNFVRTRGKCYQISEGDGLFYSYSVYDSYDLVSRWADRILLLSNGAVQSRSWFHPLLTAEGLVLIAIREPRSDKNRAASTTGTA